MTATEALPHATLIAIGAMALMTIMMRFGGYWVMARIPLTPRIQRMFAALPGSVVAALVAPLIVKEGVPALVALAIVLIAMMVRRNEFIALALAIAAAALVRAYGF